MSDSAGAAGPANVGSGRPEFERRGGTERRRTGWIVGIIVGVVTLGAIGGGIAWAVANSNAAPTTSVAVGLALEPSNLDIIDQSGLALEQILLDNVYQGLVTVDENADIVPALAEEWVLSEDALTYTFTLRPGVRFHDGGELTSADVVSTYDAVRADEAAVAHLAFARVASIEAPDDSTVEIVLAEPDANFLWTLAGRAGVVLQDGAENDRATTANGTGPFLLDEWIQGDSVTFVRNPDYWGEEAKVGEVVFRYFGNDANAAVNALSSGDIDVLAPTDANLVSQFEGDDAFRAEVTSSTDVFTLAYNNAKPPFDDPLVREALSRAIDERAFIEVLNGAGLPLGSPIPETDPGYVDLTAVNAYDPASARDLLEQAGATDLSLTLTIPNVYENLQIADLLTTQFADVGVEVRVASVDFATWLEDVYQNKDFDLSVVDHAEARDFANYANPAYYWSYDSPEVQALYAEAMASADPDRTDELLAEAAAIVAEDAPAKWLFNYTPYVVSSSAVTGFPTSGVNSRLDLAAVAVAE